MSNTVGRSGNLGLIWHGGDGTQRLGRLSVGLDLTGGISVDAGEVLVVTLAGLKSTVFGVVGGIVGASDAVVDMFTEMSSVGASRVANLEAEEISTEKAITERWDTADRINDRTELTRATGSPACNRSCYLRSKHLSRRDHRGGFLGDQHHEGPSLLPCPRA